MEHLLKGVHTRRRGFGCFAGLMDDAFLEAAFRQLSSAPEASQDSPALHNWFNEVLHASRGTEEFVQAMAAARCFGPEPGETCFSMPLAATEVYRLNLVSIHPHSAIPLHDHPDTWGAQLILRGRLRIRHFDIHRKAFGLHSNVYLRAVSLRDFSTDEISTTMPDARNIHGLEADSDNAILLSLRRHPATAAKSSCFIPLNAEERDKPLVLCRRVECRNRRVGHGGSAVKGRDEETAARLPVASGY